jgi:hypothetical protein
MMESTQRGALVLSLDVELYWGVRDHVQPGQHYEANIRGARAVIPRLLELFAEFEIACTWATVGFLFASERGEALSVAPKALPAYHRGVLNPYPDLEACAERDPLRFAADLIELIRRTPRQEIGTHTFSHYYCLEPGQRPEEFEADIAAACAIANQAGIFLSSIVFPRNQHNASYDGILAQRGIRVFRGNPASAWWRPAANATTTSRLLRAAEAFVSLGADPTYPWSSIPQDSGMSDVRASLFLRPVSSECSLGAVLQRRRLGQLIRSAARRGRVLHLWWHPHNFGRFPEANLRQLRWVLEEFSRCSTEHGMLSMSMSDAASHAARLTGREMDERSAPSSAAVLNVARV